MRRSTAMASSDRKPSAIQRSEPVLDGKRVVQVELNTALRSLGARAQSPSPFRFTTPEGKHVAGLHEIALEHEMHSAHPAIRAQFPGKLKRRKPGESARFSRFVHLHFPPDTDLDEVVRKLRALP